jgi:hypothetical protein
VGHKRSVIDQLSYSTPLVKEKLGDEGKPEMTTFFQRRIDHYGGIVIRKQTGVYLAKTPGKYQRNTETISVTAEITTQ